MWKNKHVRDLAWLIESAPMLEDPGQELRNRWCTSEFSKSLLTLHSRWLVELDHDPTELNRFLSGSENLLLGKQYELLFEFLLKYSPYFEFRSGNIQLNRGGITHSEMDFLALYLPESRWIHFEISCKYYLASANSTQHDRWVGPNGNDSLAERMSKFRRQLNLLHNTPELPIIQEMLSLEAISMGWLKGFLFVPFRLLGNHKLPKGISSHCPVGWHMKSTEIDVFMDTPGQWLILPRHDWISPWEGDPENQRLMSGKELVEFVKMHFANSNKAIMTIQLDPLVHYSKELSRGFIVRPDWPIAF
jgi:hypothetical protein